uniref:Fanconi anemia group J protein n=1 Tax=Echinococcus granulosus TaxID=6210 RepID=A0A068WH20_ECHGR|nr:Fanconi anemia group J protein [Echinococcus granulosus]
MCILSSRTRSCINPEVRKQSNVNDACQNLKGTCPFDIGKNRQIATRCMRALDLNRPWVLEEYVEAMVKAHTCPYFFAFKLFERVTLCFCPYNYLLDPVFRESVASEVSGSVVIIDEAHNIEDAARAATSVTLLEREVLAASEDLKRYLCLLQVIGDILAEDVKALINLLDAIHQVMMLTRSRLVAAGSFASSAQVWSDTEIEGLLSTVGLGVDRFKTMKTSFNRLNNMVQKEAAANRDFSTVRNESKSLSSATIRLFTYIFTMLKFMYGDDMRRIRNYRAVLTEVVNFERQPQEEDFDSSSVPMNRWLSKTRGAKTRLVERKSLSLNFWCLNPAVCMRSLAESAHSLILASGTLAPLEALAAELGVDFPVRLEASHVVPPQRVLATCVACGPRGGRLCATFANQSAFVFQDEVGHLLLEACQYVPGGVLCFFPSYSLLDKMIARWELTGLLDKLEKVKYVFREPRSSEKFDDWVAKFHDTVDSMRSSPPGGTTGALALAVCRGKISEGLDFADDYARLVVAVGIPFPAVKDPQIEQKRAFNDTLCASIPSLDKISSQTNPPSSLRPPLKRTTNETPGGCQKSDIMSLKANLAFNKLSTVSTNPLTPLRNALMNQGRGVLTFKQIKAANSVAGPTKQDTSGVPSPVLSGSEWYEAQAYRALNQALGRCIRHRGDWGAIILAEARFVEQPQRYLSGISRWLRNRFVAHERWSDLLVDLSEFVKRMTKVVET